MEKITLYRELQGGKYAGNTFVGWIMMRALSDYCASLPQESPWPFNNKETEITLTVDGHEVPLVPVLKLIESYLEKLVLEKAQELLLDKLGKVSSLVNTMEHHVKEVCYEAGLKVEE